MKQHLLFGLIVLLLLILLPLVVFSGQLSVDRGEGLPAQTPMTTRAAQALPPAELSGETVSVLRTISGQVETIGMEEYLVGVVAAEMPAASHEEALKAQAVASYTYARYRLEIAGKDSLSDSGASDQGYISDTERREKWGGSYSAYEEKIEKAVKAVSGQIITFEGQPIFAAYHAVSGGRTESASVYWGRDYSYLRSVDSAGDKLSPGYSETITLTVGEMKAALKQFGDVKLKDDPAKWFGKPERSAAGTVTEIEVGGEDLTGRQVREALGLRSANFEITYDDGKEGGFKIKCIGYGHGVGLSQHGADFMARQGAGYKEILEHYYTGCEIK